MADPYIHPDYITITRPDYLKGPARCEDCQYYERGFLSEPDECSFFSRKNSKECYQWQINWEKGERKTHEGPPIWCPINVDNVDKDIEELRKLL